MLTANGSYPLDNAHGVIGQVWEDRFEFRWVKFPGDPDFKTFFEPTQIIYIDDVKSIIYSTF